MKSPRFVGQMFAVCLPGLIAFVPALQSRAKPAPARPVAMGSVSVWHLEAGQYRQSVDTPMVLQVHSLLDQALALKGPGLDTYRRAHAVLSERYGEHMVVTSALLPHYIRVWNPVLEQWIIVCLSSATMEIDFGRGGTVVVETREEMPVE